jgi:hypothetical protein
MICLLLFVRTPRSPGVRGEYVIIFPRHSPAPCRCFTLWYCRSSKQNAQIEKQNIKMKTTVKKQVVNGYNIFEDNKI